MFSQILLPFCWQLPLPLLLLPYVSKDRLEQKPLQKDRNHISRVLPQTDDFIYKSHVVHFTLTFAEAITGLIQSFHEFTAMAYVTCHLVADKACSTMPMLLLDWAEQLISVVWIPKQIHSGYFETGERKIVTVKKSTDVFVLKFDQKNTAVISGLLVGVP